MLGHERPAGRRALFRRCGPIWLTFAAAHVVADRRGEPQDWWALAWLRGDRARDRRALVALAGLLAAGRASGHAAGGRWQPGDDDRLRLDGTAAARRAPKATPAAARLGPRYPPALPVCTTLHSLSRLPGPASGVAPARGDLGLGVGVGAVRFFPAPPRRLARAGRFPAPAPAGSGRAPSWTSGGASRRANLAQLALARSRPGSGPATRPLWCCSAGFAGAPRTRHAPACRPDLPWR